MTRMMTLIAWQASATVGEFKAAFVADFELDFALISGLISRAGDGLDLVGL